jgi:hypothetical protein
LYGGEFTHPLYAALETLSFAGKKEGKEFKKVNFLSRPSFRLAGERVSSAA